MGSWQLEVGRMVIYIGFPVALFHWFNQPENFTEHVEKTKGLYMVPEPPGLKRLYDDFVENYNKEQELTRLQQMETEHINKK